MRKKQGSKKSKGRHFYARRTYKKHAKSKLLTGQFFSNSSGGVFFELDMFGKLKDTKYYVEFDDTKGAMNGDTVIVRARERDRSAVVFKITDRAVKTIIGTVFSDERCSPSLFLMPDDSKIRFDVSIIGSEYPIKINDGDKAEVRLERYPESADDAPEGIITAVFGPSAGLDANYSAILHECGIRTEFDREVIAEADKCKEDIPQATGRLDLRDKFIITIDGEDAKDLDDAISVEKDGKDYILGVHIADVSHYVSEGSALDKEAFERGTSVYFTDKVVPMLPKALSNGICSLNSGSDRYTLSALIKLDDNGEIKGVKLKKSVINSKIRGVYSEINRLIDGVDCDELSEKYAGLYGERLSLMLELYEKLRLKGEKRGALELDSDEARIVLDNNGVPVEITKRERGVSERIIEQFMLCANEAVASWLTEKGYPCVYRIHEPPEPEKIISFVNFAHNLKLAPPYVKTENISPMYFTHVLEKARKAGIGGPVSYMVLRTMRKARYSEKNSGHFGLASKCYCHFTSPIRRYPDLAVHRIVSKALAADDSCDIRNHYYGFAASAAKASSENELKALEAERGIEELYKCIFLKEKIGLEFNAIVSSVTSFGLFCTLDNTCEGLVSVSSMKNRYYFDPDALTLSCGNIAYRLGECVRVKVENVDISARRIDFSLCDEKEPQYTPGNRGFHRRKKL